MPVSRLTAEGLADEVAAAYGAAEVRLLGLIGQHLSTGHGAPDWAEAKLAELQTFRRRADKLMASTTAAAVGQVGDAAATSYLRGAAAGQAELLAAGMGADMPVEQAERAVEALVRAQAGQLDELGPAVVRQAADGYRDAVVRASSGTLSGAATRVQDAQVALDDLARRGISGFTDSAGRQWGLESYVDMATRTTTAQAAIHGHVDRLEAGGINLFLVSTSSRECELCRPWEGKVLSRGPVEAMQRNVVTGEVERVRVDATVAEATRGGLFHPNCTHNLSGYIHGATRAGDARGNPAGYAEKQRQRALERNLRSWKRRQAVAITPEAKRKADAKVREWSGAIAEHVAATGLPRKRRRENFDTKPLPVPSEAGALRVDLAELDDQLLEAEVGQLMAANDYGPRFGQLSDELDRRDQAGGAVTQTLDTKPDPVAEQAALNRLLFGDSEQRDLTQGGAVQRTPRDREKELRDQYDDWVHQQWLRAEAETRGHLLSAEGQRAFDRGEFSVVDFFTRKRGLGLASEELQRWFAEPGNERLSFPEFRAGLVDDKKAREAEQRRRNRGWESEFG